MEEVLPSPLQFDGFKMEIVSGLGILIGQILLLSIHVNVTVMANMSNAIHVMDMFLPYNIDLIKSKSVMKKQETNKKCNHIQQKITKKKS